MSDSRPAFDHEAIVAGRWHPCRIVTGSAHTDRRLTVHLPSLFPKGVIITDRGGGVILRRRRSQVRPRAAAP